MTNREPYGQYIDALDCIGSWPSCTRSSSASVGRTVLSCAKNKSTMEGSLGEGKGGGGTSETHNMLMWHIYKENIYAIIIWIWQ